MSTSLADSGNEQIISEISNKLWQKYRIVAFVALGVFILAACLLVWQWDRERSMEEKAVGMVLKEGDKPATWEKVAKEYPKSSKGAEALLNLASESWKNQKYDDAIGYYKQFLTRYKKHPVAPAVDLAIAACLEASGKKQSAREAYFKITQIQKHPFFGAASIGLARIYKQEGNIPNARQTLNEFIHHGRPSSFLPEAKAMMAQLPDSE